MAADLAVDFNNVGDILEKRKLYRYAEQIRAAGLSVPNNIVEGSASPHPAEFRQFLNIARRSLWEDASMLKVFQKMGILTAKDNEPLLKKAAALSRKIYLFSKSLG